MSLRDELQQMMRWEISEHPEIQKAYDSGDWKSLAVLPPDVQYTTVMVLVASLRNAIYRLADEVDALKLDTAP